MEVEIHAGVETLQKNYSMLKEKSFVKILLNIKQKYEAKVKKCLWIKILKSKSKYFNWFIWCMFLIYVPSKVS